jgi:hypothetical protein
MTHGTPLACACGHVRLDVRNAPIVTAACHCNSCRAAGERLQALPGAPQILGANGGTHFVLFRKDRVRFLGGSERLASLRLTPESKTRRAIATCCNTPIFLEFESGHWLSLYGVLWPAGSRPPLDLRTMTSDLPDRSMLPDDVPNPKRHTLSFFARLLGAWIAMGFRAPRIDVARSELR